MATSPVRPRNMKDLGTIIPVDEMRVIEWMPQEDGQGTATQVHILMPIGKDGYIALRLKSRRAADELIQVLQKHTDGVWPKQ